MIQYSLCRPYFLSLYQAIRKDIESGTLEPESKLPSKRQYALDLGLSLSTVEQALEMLISEGYIESRPRKGYFVCEGMERAGQKQNSDLRLLKEDVSNPDSSFPADLWFKTMRSVMYKDAPFLSQTSPHAGSARLRNEIARYLRTSRFMDVQPEQIVIASGAQELYAMICRMFSSSLDVAIEENGYPAIERVYSSYGARLCRLPCDEDGISLSALAKSSCQFLHISPFYHQQKSSTLFAARRKAYLSWIASRSGYLIEDDFNSEFVTGGPVLQPLFSLDPMQKVIYLNTFSKTLSASLRLGYMVLPLPLLELYEKTAQDLACTVTMLEQYTLAEFIENGSFERLVARRRRHQMAASKRESGSDAL